MAEVDVEARVGDIIQLTDPDTGKIYTFDATVLMQELNNPDNDQFDKQRLWAQCLVDLKDVPQPQFTDRGKTLIYRPDANGKWNFVWSSIAAQATIDEFEARLGVVETELDALGIQVNTFIDSIQNVADPNLGANIVGFKSSIANTVGRTVAQELDDWLNVRRFLTTPVDGTTSNQAGLVTAVAIAEALEVDLYWPRGTYASTDNIPGFWNVNHRGNGVIKRGTDIHYISPKKAMQNTVHVAAGGVATNDGFSISNPISMAGAIDGYRTIGEKAQNGKWAIHIAGNIFDNGVSFTNMPAFKNRLEIYGDAPDNFSEPTSVWDGTAASEMYAFRGDWSRNTSNVYLNFRNIKFTNWNKAALAGAIVIWSAGDVLTENIWTDNCSIGAWYRQCYARHLRGRISNAQTYGVNPQYGCSANIGDLSGNGVTFVNCAEGVSVGRQTTCYIQGSTFNQCGVSITATRNSRFRSQANSHANWTNCVYFLQALGVQTPDNDSGFPDTFLTTPTDATPILRCESGSIHTGIQRFDDNINTWNAGGSLATITGAGSEVLLSAAPGVTPGDFQAARVPAYWAYSPSAKLDLEMFLSIPNAVGGTLELRGAGSAVLARLVIPANAASRAGQIQMKFMRRPGASSGRYICKFLNNVNTVVTSGASDNLNTTAVRAANESTLVYRLYWIPSDTGTVTFADMVSRVTA